MTVRLPVTGMIEAADTVVLDDTTATVLLAVPASSRPVWVFSIAMAAEGTGDTITLDTYEGTTATRLYQKAIGANENYALTDGFLLKRGQSLRATLTAGETTAVRVHYIILQP